MPKLLPRRPTLKIAPQRGLGVVVTSNTTIYNGQPASVVDWQTWGDEIIFDDIPGTFEDKP